MCGIQREADLIILYCNVPIPDIVSFRLCESLREDGIMSVVVLYVGTDYRSLLRELRIVVAIYKVYNNVQQVFFKPFSYLFRKRIKI